MEGFEIDGRLVPQRPLGRRSKRQVLWLAPHAGTISGDDEADVTDPDDEDSAPVAWSDPPGDRASCATTPIEGPGWWHSRPARLDADADTEGLYMVCLSVVRQQGPSAGNRDAVSIPATRR